MTGTETRASEWLNAGADRKSSRKYHDKTSHVIPVWNGLLEHCPRMGTAVWVFLWCLDKITSEANGVGLLLGGKPIKIESIAEDLGLIYRTVQRHIAKLATLKYLKVTRTPYGLRFEVPNSLKFGIWGKRTDNNGISGPRRRDKNCTADMTIVAGKTGQNMPVRYAPNGRNKEEAAVDSALDAAADKAGSAAAASPTKTKATAQPHASSNPYASSSRPASSSSEAKRDPSSDLWCFLGVNPNGNDPEPLKKMLEANWDKRKGHKLSEVIGNAIDFFEESNGIGWRKSKFGVILFRKLEKLRMKEKANEEEKEHDYPLYRAPEH